MLINTINIFKVVLDSLKVAQDCRSVVTEMLFFSDVFKLHLFPVKM